MRMLIYKMEEVMDNILYSIDKSINTVKNGVVVLEPYLHEAKVAAQIKDELFYNILIAFAEAVNNAIFHGNNLDYDKLVRVKIQVEDNMLDIEVWDQGVGFQPSEVDDPRDPDNLYKDSGRGVFLINNLADFAEYINTGKGMYLKMSFKLNK